MKNAIFPMFLMLAGATFAASAADDALRIDHLGTTNTLVRVAPTDSHYLMLPVQDSNEESRINVLVDGQLAETIFVRLAKSKTDYSVPFDLTPYKGHNVVFDIVSPQGRSSVREAKEDACWHGFALADTFEVKPFEKYRPAFHHTPDYGWMNDPNGMVYADGKWHLYYQWNPYGAKWQNMTWGHSSSADLVNWEHHPVAISPDGLGTIFSGSCVVDSANTAGYGENAIIALYTAAATSQMQAMAASTDGGMSFTKFPANPVLTLESEARDPNFFWNHKTGEWNMALAHALDHEMLFFSSPDLKNWTLQSAFGKGLGAQDGVWECPDLFELAVDGSDKTKWVLLCNLNPGGPFGGSATQYFVGDWDGHTFTVDTDADGSVTTKWLDFGKDHYATVTWADAPDGRRTAIGWMSNWQYAADVPTTTFRSANTLPRELGLFTAPDGRIYASSAPSPELDALRGKAVVNVGRVSVGSSPRNYKLPADGLCEIVFNADCAKASGLQLTLGDVDGDHVVVTYDAKAHTVSMDRTASGIVDFSDAFPAVTVAPTFEDDANLSFRIFVDRSSIELFTNGGHTAMTNIVFPNAPYTSLAIKALDGNAKIENLKVYSLVTE